MLGDDMEQVKTDRRSTPRISRQQAITDKYGKPWEDVIRGLYEYHDSVGGVASALGLTKPLLYRWINRTTWEVWKRQNRKSLVAYLTNPARVIIDEQ